MSTTTTTTMTTTAPPDVLSQEKGWSTAGAHYNTIIGATTQHGTTRLIDIVHALSPFTPTSAVLDVGAGGGSLTLKVKDKSPATAVLATDIAPGMLAQIDALGLPGVRTQRVDAITLEGVGAGAFSHGLSSSAIQFTPDPCACIASLYRAVRPGGVVGIAIWGPYVGPGTIHAEACRNLRADYTPAQPEVTAAWRDEETHRRVFEEAGFEGVGTEVVRMAFECGDARGACDYWFRGTNPVPGKLVGDWVAKGESNEELEVEFRRLVEGVFGSGEELYMDGVLGWGKEGE